MLNASKILFVGRIRPVIDDESADHLSCGDKDAAFTLIAPTTDDVLELQPATHLPSHLGGSKVARERHEPELGEDDLPVRLFFFCRHDRDRRWLDCACRGLNDGLGMAAVEVETGRRDASCFVRTARGVRVIPIIPAG